METRVAIIGIIIEQTKDISQLNNLLSQYGQYIICRTGLPYREKGIHIISIVLDAPQDKISALSGKLGRIEGVSAKVTYSNVITKS